MSASHPTTTAGSDAPSWVVILTAPRAEKKVESRLWAQGIEPWLPKFTDRRRWSDRWRNVVAPLFPGYLFAQAGSERLSELLRVPGVMTIVKHGGKPARLTDDFILGLRTALEQPGIDASPVAEDMGFELNERVVVSEGPLAGMCGLVREIRSRRRLVIWVQEIGRGVALTIGSASVRPVSA